MFIKIYKKLADFYDFLLSPKNLWFFIFFYVLLAGLFVQLVFLPYVVPSWHRGEGLLRGTDGMQFHRIALDLSSQIKNGGWQNWEIKPDGQIVSGVAAIFYALIIPKPWTVLPFNAVMAASSGVFLFLILHTITNNRRISLMPTLLFVFLPSALKWNTQFHNEIFSIPGMFLILLGLILLVDDVHYIQFRTPFIALFAILVGSILMFLVRDYIFSGVVVLVFVISLMLILYWSVLKIKRKISQQELTRKLFFIVIAALIMFSVMFFAPDSLRSARFTVLDTSIEDSNKPYVKHAKNWQESVFLPKLLDSQLGGLANYRNKFVNRWDDAGSAIDLDVTFSSAVDMLFYLPRATQIAFLSPFPNIWLVQGKKVAGSTMRLVTAVEMLIAYFSLLGLPLFLKKSKSHAGAWILLFLCSAMLIVYALIFPNQGALYRFRYPYYIPIIAVGLLGWLLKGNSSILD
jgi:hypothetical protein